MNKGYVLYEHKECMAKRLYYLYEKGIGITDYSLEYEGMNILNKIGDMKNDFYHNADI